MAEGRGTRQWDGVMSAQIPFPFQSGNYGIFFVCCAGYCGKLLGDAAEISIELILKIK